MSSVAPHEIAAQSPPYECETRHPGWIKTAGLTAIILLCALPFSTNIVDPDLWGHVQYGQDWLNSGELPRTATHTYADPTFRWINHENLSELTLAIGFAVCGNSGMLVWKTLLGIGLLLTLVRYAERRQVSAPVLALLCLLVAGALHVFWLLRPQLATFVGLTLWLLLLDLAFRKWHESGTVVVAWLWGFPIVELVWTNAHGGFLAGWILFGTYLSLRAMEAWFAGNKHWSRLAVHFLLVTLAAGLTMLINPYGFELVLWLIESLRRTRPEIIEWGRPDLLAPMFLPYFALLFWTVASWCVSTRRKDWVHACILGLLAWQSLSHIRHIGLFVIVTAFWSCEHYQGAWPTLFGGACRFARRSLSITARSRWQMATGLAAILLAGLLVVPLAQRMSELPVSRSTYPVDAIHYMARHRMQGRLVVSFNWAQYAIAALQPDMRVGFDGRFDTCYAPSMIDMHFDLLLGDVVNRARVSESGEIDPQRMLEIGNPDLVLLDRAFPHSTGVMASRGDYVLLYQDGVAQLWGRKSTYDTAVSPNYVAPNQRILGDSIPAGFVAWPAIPPGRDGTAGIKSS